ncbi:MAG: T9SS type A sorting domain-containing protein [Cytophagia bacterium]|nr:T9SS type A sorting domain-containing protein [Cytophagia bacterium]
MKSITTAILLVLSLSAFSQVQFQFDQGIEVTQNGSSLPRAFEGGLNSAQFQSMDLNGDGQPDLVIFHRISRSISTYLNLNNQWVFSPEYQNQFPEDVFNWLILKDFDCDGKKDLFTSTALGIKVYRNGSLGETLSWELASEFLTWDAGSNIQVAATDIPGIADVNGDGAMDILTYRFGSAGSVDYYQNEGTCGNLTFTRVTRSWGDFFDCGCNDFSFGQPCPTSGGFSNLVSEPSEQEEILHAGGKTILPFDVDNDGDIDIITSDELCENLYFLRNDGNSSQALMTSFELYPTSEPVNFQFFPSAFLEDINFDGVLDLIMSTNIDNNAGNLVNFKSQIAAFLNATNNQVPSFGNSAAFLQNEMIDVGEDAFPTFYDYDQDGDLDLFIGNTGTQMNGAFTGTIWLYENTGNQFTPSFELIETDFGNISALGYSHIKPQFADLNSDGHIDLVFQAKVGALDSRVFLKPGDGNSNFGNITDLNFEASEASSPFVYDLNKDGLPDVLIGQQFGNLIAYFNEGNSTFSEETAFGGFSDDFTKQNLSVTIGQFDSNSNPQLLSIDSEGKLTLHTDQADEHFQKSEINQNLMLFNEELFQSNFGRANSLTAADLHGDGVSSIMIGTSKGGLYFLRNVSGDGSVENELRVSISPNPSSNLIRVLANTNGMLDVIDLNGRVIEESIPIQHSVVTELQFGSISSGVYLLRIKAEDGRKVTKKIIIQP